MPFFPCLPLLFLVAAQILGYKKTVWRRPHWRAKTECNVHVMSRYRVWWVWRAQTVFCNNTKDWRHYSVIMWEVTHKRALSFWAESLNQRVTGGDNCVWAINRIREDKSLFTCPSSPRQTAIISQLPLNHREHISHRQWGRREKREDKVELQTQTRAWDLLPATVLSLAASIWPQQSRPGRVEPRLMPSHSSAPSDHSSHLTSEACLCWTIIEKAQTGKHKNNCPLLWPQEGVGHLDSSEPSSPQKITTMRPRLSQRWGTHTSFSNRQMRSTTD